jgi:hypothetical protein
MESKSTFIGLQTLKVTRLADPHPCGNRVPALGAKKWLIWSQNPPFKVLQTLKVTRLADPHPCGNRVPALGAKIWLIWSQNPPL